MSKLHVFKEQKPFILDNSKIRTPQKETFNALFENKDEREIGIVLPVGCGKSGCIAIAPFAFESERALVIAPGLNIADQLAKSFDPTKVEFFYSKCDVLSKQPFPEPVEIRGATTNQSDLDESDIVITNIQQLQGTENKWLSKLPPDYFDLILFDEGHHSVAATYESLKSAFPNAKIVNFSATPIRADGQLMSGKIVYSYPIFKAIQEGYVKRLKAIVLNPKTLKYVRRSDDNAEEEIEVSLDEVRRLGEEDADFRRSIVTSKETLITIVDASIRELRRIREATSNPRHKIIASALNYEHCHQIVGAYRSRGLRADFVHSKEDSKTNAKNINKLNNNELDVIVQVRKLGEGFDHPYLSVAAVFSVFANLSPFVQFVGRIMRVVDQNSPLSPNNQGSVVFHAGANVARVWEDFQQYSEADQEFFDQLLPTEDLNFSDGTELTVEPVFRTENTVEVREQKEIFVEEIPLLNNPAALAAINTLRSLGYSPDAVKIAMEHQPLPTTKVAERQAARSSLDARVKTETARILASRGINPEGKELDKNFIGKSNFSIVKSAIDQSINSLVGKKKGERSEMSRADLDTINNNFNRIISEVEERFFNA